MSFEIRSSISDIASSDGVYSSSGDLANPEYLGFSSFFPGLKLRISRDRRNIAVIARTNWITDSVSTIV